MQKTDENLWKKHSYLNTAKPILYNTIITEYDMVDAGFSIIKKYELLPKDIITRIDSLPTKKQKNIFIGKLFHTHSELSTGLMSGFIESRKAFFKLNDIRSESVLSIKKDAVFLINKSIKTTIIDEWIRFIPKHSYNSFVYFNLNSVEVYMNSLSGDVAIKGLDSTIVERHREFFIKFLVDLIVVLQDSNKDTTFNFLQSFLDDYLRGKLHIEYYREFNELALFRIENLKNKQGNVYVDNQQIPIGDLKDIMDISYNHALLREIIKATI